MPATEGTSFKLSSRGVTHCIGESSLERMPKMGVMLTANSQYLGVQQEGNEASIRLESSHDKTLRVFEDEGGF